jgi:hypothetical protein
LAFRIEGGAFLVLFRYGVAVLFGMSPLQEDEILRSLDGRIIGRFARREEESAKIEIAPEQDEQITSNGTIVPWEQIDLKGGLLHVRRVKQGTPATHPLTGRELRALRRLEREVAGSPFVFVSERGAPFAARGFQAMVERAGKAAGFDMKIHPHMLRHSCGYKLANDGVDTRTIQSYLGHKSIQHTVRYTELSPTRGL